MRAEIHNGNVILYGTEKFIAGQVVQTCVDDDEELFLSNSNFDNVFVYGCKQLKDSWDHKAGYVWSSRASVMNKTFGTQLVDVLYQQEGSYLLRGFAIDASVLNTLLEGTGYHIDLDNPVVEKFDIIYKLVRG